MFERLLTWPHGASCQINNSPELGTNPSVSCRQPVSPTTDLNQTGKCKPCKEQGFRIAPSAVHDGMSDFQSVWKVTLSLLLVSFERKTCSLFDNCLTFDSLLRPIRRCFFHIYLYIYVGHLEERQQGKKNSVVTFLKPFKGKLSAQLSTSDTTSTVLILSPFICVYFFLSFFLDKPSPQGPHRYHQSSRKIAFQCQKMSTAQRFGEESTGPLKATGRRLASRLKGLFRTTRSWTFTSAFIAISQIQLAAHPPFGHCRYIFLYRFRICSTVNYQLYVILEERRRAGVKQQSHQSLWLHNSCHPYSNKIYHIVNHQDANVRRVCVCVRAPECW